MEDRVIKEKTKFVDNVAYKSKFQFLIWINDNVICQRYFKINGFNEDSIHTAEFEECMDGIVKSIQRDLESKSRIYLWYTASKEPLKLTGFLSNEEAERYGEDFVNIMSDPKIRGDVEAPDGKIFHKTYLDYDENRYVDFGEDVRPNDWEYTFKFSFLIDDVPTYEKIWDGNVYPKFVRNGVDLTNGYATYNRDTSSMNFNASILRYMQEGKINLISDFIRRICNTLSNTYTDKYEYTKDMDKYGDKEYSYNTPYDSYKQSWKKKVQKKTQEYYANLFPSPKQIEYIEKHY